MHNEKKLGAVEQCVRVLFFEKKVSKAKQRGGQRRISVDFLLLEEHD